ncbi:hypothetical protein ACFVSN_41470 [Kitasatospora sp. NPDC057904]|uniref:hypothetical protein n=1 Tax=Kitasatospora sp. NPDC057904 TaxID=3346275 RepID=UPI0036D89696
MAGEVIATGVVEEIRTEFGVVTHSYDGAGARAIATALAAELAAFDISCPAGVIRDVTLMRALMLPDLDDEVALAVSRVWVFAVYVDDVCARDPAEFEAVLQAGMLPERVSVSSNARYVRHMFGELGRFCDATFLAVYKAFFYNAMTGVLMEGEFTAEASDGIDTEFVRARSGYCEIWSAALQFAAPCLEIGADRRFWAAALSPTVGFLNDFNDLLSFYKEAVDGDDFLASRIYRHAMTRGVPYLDAFRDVFVAARATHRRLRELASAEQYPYIDRFVTGFVHWHFCVPRYRWQDVYPTLD